MSRWQPTSSLISFDRVPASEEVDIHEQALEKSSSDIVVCIVGYGPNYNSPCSCRTSTVINGSISGLHLSHDDRPDSLAPQHYNIRPSLSLDHFAARNMECGFSSEVVASGATSGLNINL